MKITKKYALIRFKKAKLEDYNPELIYQCDCIDTIEEMLRDCDDDAVTGHDILENHEGDLRYYYSNDLFNMESY